MTVTEPPALSDDCIRAEERTGTGTILEIADLYKRYAQRTLAVDGVSLSLNRGEFFAILGPSGCGKSTLLRLIAGMEIPDSGSIQINGTDITYLPPRERPVNMLFQSYAVFPHMTLFENIAYGLRRRGLRGAALNEQVAAGLALVRLNGLEDRYSATLSGGQRQRAALARALVMKPQVLLLDEPLSALDARLREEMQDELIALNQKVGITFIVVTHDQSEALSMADRIAVMHDGRFEQIATPKMLYERPAGRFVADFVGKVNLLSCRFQGHDADGFLLLESKGIDPLIRASAEGRFTPGEMVDLAIRPEKIRFENSTASDDPAQRAVSPSLKGRLIGLSYRGGTSYHRIAHGSGQVLRAQVLNDRHTAPEAPDDAVGFYWMVGDAVVLRN